MRRRPARPYLGRLRRCRDHGPEILATRRHRDRPRHHGRPAPDDGVSARATPTAALRRASGRRPAGLDLHRRVRAGRGRPARRAAGDDALGATPTGSARCYPAGALDPDVLFVDDGDVLTSAGVGGRDRPVPAHGSRATTAARWPTRGPPLRGAAVAGRRPGAVHRAPAAAPADSSTGAGPGLGAGASRPSR